MKLRGLEEADVAALAPMFHGTEAELRANLYDTGRAGGANVVVAERDGAVLGCAGWVLARPWCFGAPVLARDRAAADALIAHVVGRGPGCTVRISAYPDEPAKREALVAAGFTERLDFITVARPRDGGAAGMGAWHRVGFADLDWERFADVLNTTFEGVPNTTRVSGDDLRADLERPLTSRDATAAWADERGDYAAFAHVSIDGAVATVEAIGVRAAHRGGGHARRVLDDVFARLPGCTEVRALIASTNTASLGLFRARGFTELERRTVYEFASRPASG